MLFDFEWINRSFFFGRYQRTASFFEGSELSARGRPADAAERALLAPFPGAVRDDVLDDPISGAFSFTSPHRTANNRAMGSELKIGFLGAGKMATALAKGLLQAGIVSPDQLLVEMIELPNHPYFIGCQFHPEFKSKPHAPHPLFTHFIRAAHEYSRIRPQAEESVRSERAELN